MARLKSVAFWRWLFIALLIVSLVPMLFIGLYNVPAADDYSFTATIVNTWAKTNSLSAALREIWNTIRTYYFTWQGTYSAILLFCLQPAVFGIRLYPLATVVLLGAFCLSYFYFFRKATRLFVPADASRAKALGDVFACVALLLSIQLAPSPAQCFYWWNGSIFYCFFHSLLMLMLAWLLGVVVKDQCSVGRLVCMALLGFFIAGGNLPSALFQCEALALTFLYAVWKKQSVKVKLGFVWLVVLAGLLLSALAPGNAVRQAEYPTALSVPATLLQSFHYAFKNAHGWSTPLFLTFMLFLVPFLWRLPIQPVFKRRFAYPVAVVVSFCLYASLYAPPLYAMGYTGEGRTVDIQFFAWVLEFVFLLFASIQAFRHAVTSHCETPAALPLLTQSLYRRYVLPFFACILAGLLVFTVDLYVVRDSESYLASLSAVKCLLNGEARQYGEINSQRLALLESDAPDIVLPAQPAPPFLLHTVDITSDPLDWKNVAIADYYGKATVAVSEEGR